MRSFTAVWREIETTGAGAKGVVMFGVIVHVLVVMVVVRARIVGGRR